MWAKKWFSGERTLRPVDSGVPLCKMCCVVCRQQSQGRVEPKSSECFIPSNWIPSLLPSQQKHIIYFAKLARNCQSEGSQFGTRVESSFRYASCLALNGLGTVNAPVPCTESPEISSVCGIWSHRRSSWVAFWVYVFVSTTEQFGAVVWVCVAFGKAPRGEINVSPPTKLKISRDLSE